MAVVLPKSLFIHTPKAGGSWVKALLTRAGTPHRLLSPHLTHAEAVAECPEAAGLPSFSFTRHPYTWYQSYWCFKERGNWDDPNVLDKLCRASSFEGFVMNVLERQPGMLLDFYQNYTRGVTFVSRFEHLRHSLAQVFEKTGDPLTPGQFLAVPNDNVTSREVEWRERCRYTPALLAAISEADAQVFSDFHYSPLPVPEGGLLVWLTGLPASGKTTLARRTAEMLGYYGVQVEVLDGDILRSGISADLGFSKEARNESVRRAAETALGYVRSGAVTIVAMVSPYREARQLARKQAGKAVEVHVKCPIDVCMQRDPKGLYARARVGEIRNVTGLDDPYEEPESPELTIETATTTVDEGARRIALRVMRELT